MTTTITTYHEPIITSLDIAEITGKNHKDIMRAIRNMEPDWVKVNGRKFALVEYVDKKGEVRPCYSINKTEFIYIISKFHDETRAKLSKRWEELELQEQERQQQSQLQMMQVLSMQNQVLEKLTTSVSAISQQVNELRPLAQLGSLALEGTNCIYFADMAKILTQRGYKIGQNQLFQLLRDKGYIYKNSTRPMQEYVEQGLFYLKETFYTSKNGRKSGVTTMITAKGQEYFLELLLPNMTVDTSDPFVIFNNFLV